jgi:hypothetical protein
MDLRPFEVLSTLESRVEGAGEEKVEVIGLEESERLVFRGIEGSCNCSQLNMLLIREISLDISNGLGPYIIRLI